MGAAALDDEGRVTSANAALGVMLGYDSPSLVGRAWEDLLAPGERASLPDPGAEAVERRYLAASGMVVWGATTTAVAVGVPLVFVRDLTALKVAETRLARRSVRRSEAESGLRQAIDAQRLCLHYQPIIELSTGKLSGVEALLRQELPDGRILPAGQIVPLAEETGLIVPLGRWIIGEALHCANRLRQRHPARRPLSMSVNVSARQLEDPGFARDVAELLDRERTDPRLLTLEITESVMVEDIDRTVAQLRALADLGVRLAIDDFGTGYSSLNLLRRLPIDVLKVDKSFVDRISTNRTDAAVVAAIVELAGVLGLEVVAEGIEESAQVERLLALFCRYGQGFHFARPLPEEAAEQFVATWRAPADHPAVAARPELWGSDHIMQFYENDELVVASISEYVERGLTAGEGVIVVATAPHRGQLEVRLASRGIDAADATRRGQLVVLDAAQLLSRFMLGGLPDATAFEATVGRLVDDTLAAWPSVRIFGEMVGILWSDGQVIASIRLEELWNELRTRSVFTLLCAYALPAGQSNVVAAAFGDICAQHGLVERAVAHTGS